MKQEKGAEKRSMGEISTDKGEVMKQGTPHFFSTAICLPGGRIRDIDTGAEWDNVEAWHAERDGRAATLTFSFGGQAADHGAEDAA